MLLVLEGSRAVKEMPMLPIWLSTLSTFSAGLPR